MLSSEEIRRGLRAAWLLLLDKQEALTLLDTSFNGFWRSFLVIVLLAPVYALYIMAERNMLISEFGVMELGAGFWVARIAALLIDWAAFPLAAATIAGALGFSRRYVTLIVAYNWSAPLIAIPLIVPAILVGMNVAGPEIATLLVFLAFGHAIRYRFVTARQVLEGRMGLAAGLVALEIALSLLLGQALRAGTELQ